MPFDLIESSEGVVLVDTGPVDLVEETNPTELLGIGIPGLPGEKGDSSYQVWLDAGNSGTVDDYIAYLKGAKGDQGLPGLAGVSYEFSQGVPSDTWVISHMLGRYPSVTVVDSSGSVVEGEIVYDSSNQLTLLFSVPFAGKAYLN